MDTFVWKGFLLENSRVLDCTEIIRRVLEFF